MKAKLLLLSLSLFSFINLFSTNNLRIIDPEYGSWYNYSASIKTAELQVKPMGAYVENNLYLTIGLTEPFTDNSRKLEIIFDFELPSNSLITDSWLWIEGVPKQAEILDRWTASNIYEEIVNRRKDPSLLVKNGDNQYCINVYPMSPNETRKFKITYLTPINWSKNQISCDYPSGIIRSSATLSDLTVYAYPNGTFNNPALVSSGTAFKQLSDSAHGNCCEATIPNSELGTAKITFTDSNSAAVKLYKYGTDDEGYYQFSFVPSDWVQYDASSKKICYLIDYDNLYVKEKKQQVISTIFDGIASSLSPKDSFNIIFSNLGLDQAFSSWQPATPENIQKAQNSAIISDYSNLVQLIAKGVNYLNNNGGSGKIVLITNNSVFEGISKANDIMKDLNALNSKNLQIDVINYMDSYYNYYWINNNSSYGNEYLLSNIARTNGGNYYNFYDEINVINYSTQMTEALSDITNSMIENLDVYTDTQDGYTYGRMTFTSGKSSNFRLDKAIHQVGKYKGKFPLSIEISGEVNNNMIHSQFSIQNSDIIASDSTIETIWNGLDIMQLEDETQNSQIINEIISQSVENRILSTYTAFLCVEDSIEICENCGDENKDDNIHTGGIETLASSGQFKAFPNPFVTDVELIFPEKGKLQKIEIYNIMGQCIRSVDINEQVSNYKWDGKTDNGTEVRAGIYLVVARFNNKVLTLKVQKK